MTELQKALLSMIKAALWNTEFECTENIQAVDLYQEASRYEIVGVLSSKIDIFCKNDKSVRKQWNHKALVDYHKTMRVLTAQDNLTRLLKTYDITPVFLKGTASAFYYPEPALRQIGDIDFLVLPDQFEKCCEILENNGFEKGMDEGRHVGYEKQGIEYECHRYFSRNIDKYDKKMDRYLYDAFDKLEKRTIEGRDFFSLPDEEYGLVLLEHMKHHLYGGMGFRQIMDWVTYAGSVLDDEMWKSKFSEMVKECGLEQFAKVVTRTAQLYLGLPLENRKWCMDINDEICNRLVYFILSCNNFGMVNEEDDSVHYAGIIFRNNIWQILDVQATYNIPIAKKYIILRPIAWIYQIVRWSIKGITGIWLKGFTLSGMSKNWNNQKKLLKDLGL